MEANYFHLTRASIAGFQSPGFPQRAWIAECDWFAAMAPLAGSEGADAVTYNSPHFFKPGKGWVPVRALTNSVQGAFRSTGDWGAHHGVWEPQAFWPGDTPALQQMVEQMKTQDYVLLFEDRDAGSNEYIQFGTKDQPVNFKVEYESGTTHDGKKGWKITGCTTTRYFYSPQSNVGYHPMTIAFLNTLAFDENIELSLESELILDRLVRDIHGEANLNYDTYDVSGKGIAVYPVIGGSADTHKYNLLNPADTDAAYRLKWAGAEGEVHDENGITWDGASFANTYIDPQHAFTDVNDGCVGVMILELNGEPSALPGQIGVTDSNASVGLALRVVGLGGTDTYIPFVSINCAVVPGTAMPPDGAFTVGRRNTNVVGVVHDTGVGAGMNATADTLSSETITVGTTDQSQFVLSRVGGYWVFHALTNDEMEFVSVAMREFNVALGRY